MGCLDFGLALGFSFFFNIFVFFFWGGGLKLIGFLGVQDSKSRIYFLWFKAWD